MDQKADQIVRRLGQLKSQRSPHERVWRECFEHTYPLKSSGFQSDKIDAQQGQSKQADLLDSTATESSRVLASAIMSGMTPANARWFQLDTGMESEDERRWLDGAAQALWENIHMSNFDSAAFEAVLDVVCAGWFALYIDEDRENGGLRFEQWPLSGLYVAASKAGGKVDSVYRCYQLTAEQAVSEFGEKNVSPQTAKLAKDKPDEKVEFVHAIYPRQTYAVGAKMAKNMPIASCQVECGAKKIVRESGYHEMPVVVPRWMLIPDTAYGVGPVFDALPDAKMLNAMWRMDLASGDLAIAGMWIAEDDGVLNPRTVKVGPRKIIVANSVDSMKPLQTGANFNYSEVRIEKLQARIRKTMMADQLQPQDGPAMTATEVHVRVNLIRQLLGPIYGRLQAEYLQPMIERCFGLAYRAGALLAPPESLAGRSFTVKYISPLARAQKLEDVTAMDRFEMSLANQAQFRGPEALDCYDADKANKLRANLLGVPADLIVTDRDMQATREGRQQAAEAAQQNQQAMAMQQEAGKAMLQKAAA